MKVCPDCKIEKPLSDFPWRPDKNIYRPRCKPCYNASRAHYNRSEGHKQACKKYTSTEHGKAMCRAACARFRQKNAFKVAIEKSRAKYPEKRAAQIILMNSLSQGKITRPNACSICMKPCKPEGHHPDYSKPLAVIWVCKNCHTAFHWSR